MLYMLIGLGTDLHAEVVNFVTTDFPPYVISHGNQYSGLEVDVTLEVCRRLNLECNIEVMRWNRALTLAKEGKVDGVLMPVFTPERAQYLYFTSESSGRERIAVMALQGSGLRTQTIDDLRHEKFGVVLGYSYGAEFDQRADLARDVSPSNEVLLRRMQLKRVRVAVSDMAVLQYVARQNGYAPLDVVAVLSDNPQYIAFSKAIGTRAENLAARFSKALKDLHDDGTFRSIERKYF